MVSTGMILFRIEDIDHKGICGAGIWMKDTCMATYYVDRCGVQCLQKKFQERVQ